MKRWQLPFRDLTRLRPPSPHDGNGARPQVRLRSADAAPQGHRRQRPRLLQPLPLAGLVLVVIALAGYWSVYSGAAGRTAVLVAARDLPAGATLSGRELRVASLAGDQAVLAGLLPAQELGRVRGRRLATPLLAGQPLPRAALAARTRGPAAFTLAVPALHALGGELQPGDRVSVLVTYGSGQGQARAQAIARGLTVLSLGAPPTGLDRATATIAVTVALPDPSLASALALANSDGKIDLLRERGNSSAPIPAASVRAAP
jgi:Flp pilus assembly protein CpaB